MPENTVAVFYGRNRSAIGFAEEFIADVVARPHVHPLHTRVKGGLLLALAEQEASGARYSTYADGSRKRGGFEFTTHWIADFEAKKKLLEALEYGYRAATFKTEATVGTSYECLVFSSIELDQVVNSASRTRSLGQVEAVASFSPNNPLCYKALWQSLLLRYLLLDDIVLEASQESLWDIGFDETGISNQDWSSRPRPWKTPGLFSDEFLNILVEHRLAHLKIPPDLLQTETLQRSRKSAKSPVQRVLYKLPAKTVKLSRIDDPSKPARFQLGDPRWQWPDPEIVAKKVRHYCLKVGHPLKKWQGFKDIGFVSDRPGDVEFLSNTFCSALIDNTFEPFDVRVDADGTLEFAVNVVIPCRSGKFRNIFTAWNAKPGSTLSLSSAFVAPPAAASCSLPILLPAGIAENDWGALHAWARDTAVRYGRAAVSTSEQARGWLWLPHTNEKTRNFATWYRHNSQGLSHIFTRTKLGGRCTQFGLEASPIVSLGEKIASLRMAQACLGAAGVRSVVEVQLD